MNSIRPLITISILIAAGVFLYTKINENPAHLVPDANDAATSGVPPLNAPGGAPNGPASLTPSVAWNNAGSSSGSTAPQWPTQAADATKSTPASPPLAGGAASSDSLNTTGSPAVTPDSLSLPEVPKIPDLPPLPSTAETISPPTVPSVTPLSLNPSAPMQAPLKADDAKSTSGDALSMGGATPQSAPPMAAANTGGDERQHRHRLRLPPNGR
jgi:hypothetical protein